MASSCVADFVQKKYKRYSCKQVRLAQKSLKKAFKASRSDAVESERKMFGQALAGLNKSETGKEILSELSKLGYDFIFDIGDFGGYCSHSQKKIALNPECGLNWMQGMTVHEGTHAIQKIYEKDFPDHPYLTIASFMKLHRAKEADATARESAFIYQTRKTNPENFADEMGYKREPVMAYVNEMERSGDEKKAMQASFKAWYTSDFYRKRYDKEHKGFIKNYVNYGIKYADKNLFSETLTDKEIASICRLNGSSYMPQNFFSSEQAFSIPSKEKAVLLKQIERYSQKVGVKTDKSILKMFDRSQKTDKKVSESSVLAVARKQQKVR